MLGVGYKTENESRCSIIEAQGKRAVLIQIAVVGRNEAQETQANGQQHIGVWDWTAIRAGQDERITT